MNVLNRMDRALGRVEGWLVVLFLSLMVTLTFLQVALRALFLYGHLHWANRFMGQMDWAEPLVRLLVLWVSFLGASLVTGENKHIKLDVVSDLMPRKWVSSLRLLVSASSAVITGFMLKASIHYVRMEASFGGELFAGLPNWIGQLILPIGFSIILFRFALKAVQESGELVRRIRS